MTEDIRQKQQNHPKISVVISNYNYGRYLNDTVNSVLHQTYPDVEVVVVDDGSTDDSPTIIRNIRGIKSILKENGGQTSAIRCALTECTGDILVLLDADDMLLPTACERIIENWRADLSLLQYCLEKRTNDGTVVGYYPDATFLGGGEREYVLQYGSIPSSPASGNAFAAWYVRKIFERNFDLDRAPPDGYLIFTAPLYGEVFSLKDVLGVYRVHQSNVSSKDNGTRVRWLKHYIQTNYTHRIVLADHARLLRLSERSAEDYFGPYEWRAALHLKRLAPFEPEVACFSVSQLVMRAMLAFIRYPNISYYRKLKNIIGVPLMSVVPASMIRRYP